MFNIFRRPNTSYQLIRCMNFFQSIIVKLITALCSVIVMAQLLNVYRLSSGHIKNVVLYHDIHAVIANGYQSI